MRILVTGVSGFSGSYVARALARAGHEVTGLHRSETRFLATLKGEQRIGLVRADLGEVQKLPGPFEAVVHTAATSPAPGVDTARMAHDNVAGTKALIDAALGWRSRAFIFFSSLSLYGNVSAAVVDETTPIIDPDAYGATKHLCELMLADHASTLPSLSLRLPGVLGPGAHRNWMSRVTGALQKGEIVRAYKVDGPFNNAAYVSDISDLIKSVLTRTWEGNDAVVLGAGGMTTVRAAIERLAAGLGVPARIEDMPSAKVAFTLSSDRALARWGYAPMEIGALIGQYARDVVAHERGR